MAIYVKAPSKITKRDGTIAEFDSSKITDALRKCYDNIGLQEPVNTTFDVIVNRVVNVLSATPWETPTVERVQDLVELTLQAVGEYAAAKNYILYRAERAKVREAKRPVPQNVRAAFEESRVYFQTPIQQFQFFDKYSRFDYDKGRRETWKETVARATWFLNYLVNINTGYNLEEAMYRRIYDSILNMNAMPSMRLLAMAGDAAIRDNCTIYNCTYLPVNCVEAFKEGMLLSMAGCGVGFSVESQYVEQFPRIVRQRNYNAKGHYVIGDTTQDWAHALQIGIEIWMEGGDIEFDYSHLRPAGSPLRIKGGRSSGPEPLKQAMRFIRARILSRQGSYLRPIDAHDIMCMVGAAAVSGGVRRNAMISLFDYDDMEMRLCKSGDFERENNQRWNANNSAVWPEHGLDQIQIIEQTLDMVRSQRGEPGIFNRAAAIATMPEHRRNLKYDNYGTNPCGEIVLREHEMCNLSIAVARPDDSFQTLWDKVEVATILGTIQSLATYFPDLRSIWKKNAEEERLLGVDITGQRDCMVVQNPFNMRALRQHAIDTNERWAKIFGINKSASVTCVKPSGNSGQLLNVSSGIHPRWAKFYERNVRVSAHSPILKVLRDANVPMDPENGQDAATANTWVIHFPVKSPDGAVVNLTALDQCEYWKTVKLNWTTHNPSVTITYRPNEIADIIKWICDNKDIIGGMAFLPHSDAQYAQLPYIEITEEEYNRRASSFPDIDYSKIYRYESTDLTTVAQEIACMSGECDL